MHGLLVGHPLTTYLPLKPRLMRKTTFAGSQPDFPSEDDAESR